MRATMTSALSEGREPSGGQINALALPNPPCKGLANVCEGKIELADWIVGDRSSCLITLSIRYTFLRFPIMLQQTPDYLASKTEAKPSQTRYTPKRGGPFVSSPVPRPPLKSVSVHVKSLDDFRCTLAPADANQTPRGK